VEWGGADNGGYDKVTYLEETCIIKMFGKANVHTQICIQQMAEYAQNGADCLELLFCINVTETKSNINLKQDADWKMKSVWQ